MGKKRNDREFWDSALMNNALYRFYYYQLTQLAISMFEWKNLPDSVDPRYLELTLFANGSAVFFKDEQLGYLALQTLINGPLSVYRIPKKRRAFSVNGYQKDLDSDNSVIIFNNMLHLNTAYDVELFARKLWDIDAAIQVNAKMQKTPGLVKGTEEQRHALLNLYKKYEGNEPFIFADKSLNVEQLTYISTEAPYVADKLYTLKTQIWNEALTYLGITNINYQKKERLISDEVTRQNGGTFALRYSRLTERQNAAKAINDMFGLNIEVDFRNDFREMDDEFMLEENDDETILTPMVTDLRSRGV